ELDLLCPSARGGGDSFFRAGDAHDLVCEGLRFLHLLFHPGPRADVPLFRNFFPAHLASAPGSKGGFVAAARPSRGDRAISRSWNLISAADVGRGVDILSDVRHLGMGDSTNGQ